MFQRIPFLEFEGNMFILSDSLWLFEEIMLSKYSSLFCIMKRSDF